VITLLGQSQRQALQVSGVQIGIIIYNENHLAGPEDCDIIFRHLMRTLQHTKFKECRKKIIKLLKAPTLIQRNLKRDLNRAQEFEQFEKQLQLIVPFLVPRLLDAEIEVRFCAYKKLRDWNVKLEDVHAVEGRMVIIKEGMTDVTEIRNSLQPG